MPTMSSRSRSLNSTSAKVLSSPPKTRCRSCLAGLGVLSVVITMHLLGKQQGRPCAHRLAAARPHPAGNAPLTLLLKRFGSLLCEPHPTKAARDGRSGVDGTQTRCRRRNAADAAVLPSKVHPAA